LPLTSDFQLRQVLYYDWSLVHLVKTSSIMRLVKVKIEVPHSKTVLTFLSKFLC